MSSINFAFFGTSELSVKVLDILMKNGYTPEIVITAPDKPKGRKMILTPPPVKVFAQVNNLKIAQPASLSTYHSFEPEGSQSLNGLPPRLIGGQATAPLHRRAGYDLLIVASYGKIIPKSILEIPKFGTLNIHPSLLPKFRGPSPIQSFIMSGEEETGVTIMLMDEQVDHGKILSRKEFEARSTKHEIRDKSEIRNPKLNAKELEEKLAEIGGQMLVEIIP